MPRVSNQLDYEVELVVVIGKSGRHIPAERAHEHVFGYSVGNDVTVRDWQFKTPQWMLGKSFDSHCLSLRSSASYNVFKARHRVAQLVVSLFAGPG